MCQQIGEQSYKLSRFYSIMYQLCYNIRQPGLGGGGGGGHSKLPHLAYNHHKRIDNIKTTTLMTQVIQNNDTNNCLWLHHKLERLHIQTIQDALPL